MSLFSGLSNIGKEIGKGITNPMREVGGYATGQLFGSNAKNQFQNNIDDAAPWIGGAAMTAVSPWLGAGALLGNNMSNSNSNSGGTVNNGTYQPYSMTQTDVNGRNMITTNLGQQADGKPNYSPFESMRDSSGNLNSNFQLNGGSALGLDQTAYNKLKTEMTSPGLTSYGQAQMDLVNDNSQKRLDSINSGAANSYQTGLSNMMLTGGLDAGARERMGIASNRNSINATMGAMGDATTQRLGVLSEDAKTKLNGMEKLHQMGMDNYSVGAKERDYTDSVSKFNIGQRMGDLNSLNNYNMNNYNEQIRAWANGKVSEAQARAAKEAAGKGGLLNGSLIPGIL